MEKTALAILMILVACICSATGTTLPDPKTLDVSLDLSGGESQTAYFDFGFSSTEVGSGKENEAQYEPTLIEGNSLSLSLPQSGTESGRIATNTTTLYAYWHITYGSDLEITIKGNGDMAKDGADAENDTIGWNIAIATRPSAFPYGTEQMVYDHEPATNGVGADGSVKISLTTDDLTGLTLEPGVYSSDLILSIKNN